MKLPYRRLKSDFLIVLLILITGATLTASREDHDNTGRNRKGSLNPFPNNPDNNVFGRLIDDSASRNQGLEFTCVKNSIGWRPQSTRKQGHREPFPPLGPGFISTEEICEKVIAASKNGIVCSKTKVGPGYTPTHFSGSTETSPDFGFLGLPTNLESCLIATENSLPQKICYLGEEGAFIVGDIKGHNENNSPKFSSIEACVKSYGAIPKKRPPGELLRALFKNR